MQVGLRGSARRATLAVCLALLAACGPGVTPAPAPTAQPAPAASPSPAAAADAAPTAAATPSQPPAVISDPPPQVAKTVVIGITQPPDTLFGMESVSVATGQVLGAIRPACITSLSYEYQPVCVTKLPSFEDGDAITRTVTVDSAYKGNVIINNELITDTATLTQPIELTQFVVTWTLIDGLKWDDGTPLTARDFVFGFNLSNHPRIKVASRYGQDRTAGYAAPDDKTVVWTGVPGHIDATYFLNLGGPEPEHVLGEMAPGEIGASDYANRPLGYGPYKIVDHVPLESTTLIANEHYWQAGEGLPKIGNLVFKYLTDETQALQQLEGGEIDVISSVTLNLSNAPKLDEFERAGIAKAQYVPATVWEHLDFAVERGDGVDNGLGDAQVRRALAYAINRQEIIDKVLNGKTVVMNSFVPHDHWTYPPNGAGLEPYAFDPAKSKALLAEAGWTPGADGILAKGGKPLKLAFFTTEGNETRRSVAQIIQENLKAIGVDVELNFVPGTAVLFATGEDGTLSGRTYDLALYAWAAGPEPSTGLYLCGEIPTPENNYAGQNTTGWCNAEYDKAARAAGAEIDRAKRIPPVIEAQKIWNAELPVLPLYQRVMIIAYNAKLSGVKLDPTNIGDIWNVETWDISE